MKKRLIILFACLAIVIMVVIFATVVFTVRNIEVLVPDKWENQFNKVDIVKASGVRLGASIFALSEKKAIAAIEQAVPYAKVVTIERVFPSTVRINIVRRDPILALEIGTEGKFFLLDREFKVLETINASDIKHDSITVINGYTHIADNYDIVGEYLPHKSAPLSKIADVVKACEKVDIINGKLPVFTDSFNLSKENYIIVRTVKGINIAIKTDANPIEELFSGLYNVFVSSTSQHDKSLYITNSAGGIVVLTEEQFNSL